MQGTSLATGSSLLRRMRKCWQLYVILLLPILWLLIFSYGPMYGVLLAFKRYSPRLGIWKSPWVGITYFKQFFSSKISLNIIWNTFAISIYSIIAGFPIPILLAISLTEIKAQSYKRFVQKVVYAPYFISTIVLVGMMMLLLEARVGIINRLMGVLGISPVNFMGRPDLFRSVYVWSGVWQTSGYSCIVYIAALAGISREVQEAAIIDGASKLKRIIHVDLPSIKPTITIILILGFGYTMSVGFEKVFLMQNSLNTSTSEIISTYVYKVGLQSNNYGLSTAISLLNSLINLALLLMANLAARRLGETSLW